MSLRLKTEIAVSALLRRAQVAGAFAVIVRKGDDVAGAYMVCVRKAGEMTLYTSERDMSGEVVWFPKGPMSEIDAMNIINRRVDRDPDLWVVEIEDAQGRSFVDAPKQTTQSDARAAAEALFPGRSPRR